MGQVDGHEFEERVPGFARCGSRNDSSRRGRHYQHQFACGKKRAFRRRNLLRLKMGTPGVEWMHGGRVTRARNSREHGLPGQRGNRVFRAWTEGSGKSAETGGCSACGGNDSNARRAKLRRWSGAEAAEESLIFPLDSIRYNNYKYCMSSSHLTNPYQPNLDEQVSLLILRAADYLGQQTEEILKPHGLTGTQYNVLRILRGAGPQGLPCKSVGCRMISHDPDMTRLLDRMEKRGLIARERQKDDRRVVKARITPLGLDMLKKLDQPVREMHRQQFEHMSSAKLKQLAELLGVCQKTAPDQDRKAS